MIEFFLGKPPMGIVANCRQNDSPKADDLEAIWLMIKAIEANDYQEKLR